MVDQVADTDLIKQKQDIFKQKKDEILSDLNKLRTSDTISKSFKDNDKIEIYKTLENVIYKLRSGIYHYEEVTLLDYFREVILAINNIFEIGNFDKYIEVKYYINEMSNFLDRFIRVKEDFQSYTLNDLSTAIMQVHSELSVFRRLRSIADTALTEKIYHKAVEKYQGLETEYRRYFYWAIALTVGLSLFMFLIKNPLVDRIGEVEFWVIKVSILAVGITLITYFLKQSAHYQRLADQNYQTQVELQAYPSFMESIPTNEAASVRKELALKYFGREIDGAAHKDMSNLISDQMKSTTEMVKAATDVLKAKGGN